MRAVVLFSGGLDSTTCLASAVKSYGADNVLALSLYYGQKHDKEIACAKEIVGYYGVKHRTLDVGMIFNGSDCTLLSGNADVPDGEYSDQMKKSNGKPVSTYVPFRNGLFLSIAASVALSEGYDAVIYGAHKDDAAGSAYPDCSVKFLENMNDAVREGTGGQISLIDPYIDKTKADIVADGIILGVPYEMTWSCYKGGDKPCGKCGTCIDRIKAFEKNGRKDPLYEKD